ncbi:MAG: hypothetical protein G3M70_07210 [Candidatus Nitronauta litoralis]|uniref:Mor transcription activator domain-containing protein n=1 Tax=Candidatus Nitronauta litoralis TaxID=2705533 RepID=A0A7T0FZL0_9BACT|nr:MAG: hypothetical protein G3M70_07210 [Candidatus Nitronauta litoralis]
MRFEPWMKEIEINDLPEVYQGLAEKIGLEHTLIVMRTFDGEQKYFRRVKTSMTHVRDRVMFRNWNGYNESDLAEEFDLTTRMVQIILGKFMVKECRSNPRQESLYDE